MASIGSTSAESTTQGVTTPTPKKLATSVTPNAETSYTLPTNSRRFLLTNRGSKIIKVGFSAGSTASLDGYKSLDGWNWYSEGEIQRPTLTLYFSCAAASQEFDIVSWQ